MVLNAHDQLYERFAPQNPDGTRDDKKGIREFIVGTGGQGLSSTTNKIANSEVVKSQFGYLLLELKPYGYNWAFKDRSNNIVDKGTGLCH